MYKHFARLTTAALTVTAIACSAANNEPQKDEKQRGGDPGAQARVALTGCVQGAPGNTYELHSLLEVSTGGQPANQQPGNQQSGNQQAGNQAANQQPANQQSPGQQAADTRPAGMARASRERLPSGSWVRLTSGSDLKQYVGQRVTIEGWISDTGESTMGTTGSTQPRVRAEDRPGQSTNSSMEPGVRALANGNAPSVAVERVNAEGPCAAGR
jgi:hypothetical protein